MFCPRGIYAILDRTYVPPEDLPAAAVALATGGVRWIQLRWKGATARQLFDAAVAVRLALRGGPAVRLVVNDRPDVAVAAEADGVHVGQDDLPPSEARLVVGGEACVGLSTHDAEEIRAAANDPVDYLGLGPVFRSATKTGHAEPLGIVRLRGLVAMAAQPVVAIGGVTIATFPDLRRAGATAAAMAGELLAGGDIAARASAAVTAWETEGR